MPWWAARGCTVRVPVWRAVPPSWRLSCEVGCLSGAGREYDDLGDQRKLGSAAAIPRRSGGGRDEENFVWMTTRRIKPGTLADFERTWRPERHPDGMLHAYAYWSDDEQEIIAVSSWVSREACDAWRASWEETRRRAAMAPYVVSEQEGFTAAAS